MRAVLDRSVAYPALYLAFIALSILDLICTTLILAMGGAELNGIAARALDLAGLHGLVVLKFASVVTVLLICESLAHRGGRAQAVSRRVAEWAVAISAIPVTVALVQLAAV
jgi:hypothetical protein